MYLDSRFEQLFSTTPDKVATARKKENLTHYMPEGFSSFEELDTACLDLQNNGRLVVVSTQNMRANMAAIKDPYIPRAEFQRLAMQMITHLTLEAERVTRRIETERKVAISVRGGTPFEGAIVRFMPGAQYGFSEQARDEKSLIPSSTSDKFGSFVGLQCIAVDFMLATGGSLDYMVKTAQARGAVAVTTVTGFSSPQGIMRIAQNEGVDNIISLPLEAGLNYIDEDHHGYIVGGQTPYSMLGDFGDRFCGSTSL